MLRKIIFTLCALICVVGTSTAQEQDQKQEQGQRYVLDKVIAVVGNSPILYSEVKMNAEQLIERRRSEGYTLDRDPMNEVLENLMEQRLLAAQARIDSVSINVIAVNSQVSDHVNAMVEAAGGIAAVEREQSMKLFNLRENLRVKYEEQAYASGMRYEIIGDVVIVPGEVEKYYNNIPKDELPLVGDQYTYAQITRLPTSIDEAKRRVKERLLEMRGRVIRGETRFSILAQMYSVDPGSAYKGGEMSPQPSSAFVAPFAEALEGLRPGQVSEIVETEFGFHIIELIDKSGDLYHCRHILLRPTYTTDELSEPTQFLDSILVEIKRDSLSFEMAAKLHSDDKSSKMNGGIVSNHDLLQRYNANDPKLTVTKFLKEDFGARGYKSIDDFTALSKLSVGEISAPFATEDMVGNQMSKIVKLVEIIPAHSVSLELDYLKIEELALEDKKKKVLKDWMTEYIERMYVFIEPEYRSNDFDNKAWLK
ncbi:MAG: peptidylprolyl isomerase [Rikenellaceae bacterium]